MGISILSWLVPFLKINIVKEQVIEVPKALYFANIIADKNSRIEQEVIAKSSQFTWDIILLIIGITVSILFIVRFLKSLWNIRNLIRQYPFKKIANLYLVLTNVKGTPFSFFKYIFWNTSIDLDSEVGMKILAHEVAHVEENHSFDKLLIEVQLVIGWFNPIIWLIRNELYLIHEFIADKKSIQNNDTSILAELLLTSAYPSQRHLLSNSFFFSPIKRRIRMFTKTNTKYSYLRRLAILPIMAAMVLLFAFRNDVTNIKPIAKLDKHYTVIIDDGYVEVDYGGSIKEKAIENKIGSEIASEVQPLRNYHDSNDTILLAKDINKGINNSIKNKFIIKTESIFTKNENKYINNEELKNNSDTDSSLIWPVENGEVKNKFGKSLIPGTNNLFTNNTMLNIFVPLNSVVKSVKNGEVVFVRDIMGVMTVMIKHVDIYSAYYGINTNVKTGQIVSLGQVIGHTSKMPNGESAFEFGISDKEGRFIDPQLLVKKL